VKRACLAREEAFLKIARRPEMEVPDLRAFDADDAEEAPRGNVEALGVARRDNGGFKFGRKHRSHALIEVVDGKDVQTIVRGGAGAN
jgi:hypothetical protein